MPLGDRVHTERHRAESFGEVASQYDRFRPSYPSALIDDLVALGPDDVLDIGCGTGKAGRLLVERDLPVLGVEIDPQMADVARSHGLAVEVASFEQWNARERQFDLAVCGQAWHWIDPAIGVPKVAAVLRPAGTFALFWNVGDPDQAQQAVLDEVYRRLTPELARKPDENRSEPPYADDLRRSGLFASVDEHSYRWRHTYPRDDWLALIQTHSDHLTLDPDRRAALLAGVGAAIDAMGGEVLAQYRTRAWFALRHR